MDISSAGNNLKDLLLKLQSLESRIAEIEDHLDMVPRQKKDRSKVNSDLLMPGSDMADQSDQMEFQIGEYWFAKVGILILAIGIAFLLTFPYQNLHPAIPVVAGYLLVGVIMAISHLWRQSFALISRYLLGGGLILLYFSTLRLHYFGEIPIIGDNFTEIFLLIIIVCINLYISLRRKSIYLTSVSVTLGYITAILCDQPVFLFTIVSLLSAFIVFVHLRNDWRPLLNYGIILTYFTHFLWFLNNPLLGNKLQLVSSPYYNTFFILLYGVVFSLANLIQSKESPQDNRVVISSFLNSLGCYGLYLIITVTKFQDNLAVSHLIISIIFITLAILFWKNERNKYTISFYAIIGYTALSVMLIAQFAIPDSFIWLSWQSLLVITTAIWFRARFIIYANFFIYIFIFIGYLILAGTVNIVSLSFGIVALITARILNWQKDRLELKTELMRNSYLASAFFMFPYGLYHTVPEGFVSLSWVGVAGVYYLLSIILNNKKYRWMALLTFLLTSVYVLAIGTINFDPVFRLISFIVLGVALIIVSLLYTKVRSKNHAQN